MRTLAVAQQKGGVGKTVTSINVAGSLADQGNEVLLVDADPQGGLTVGIGFEGAYLNSDDPSLYDVLTSDVDEFDRINELIREHAEFDVLTASARNFQYEPESYSLPRTQERLGLALERIEKSYDYILIDCPPSMGSLTDGALLSGDVLLVSKPSTIATFSLKLLYDEIQTLESTFETQIGIVGAVVNAVPNRSTIAEERLQWFNETFKENYTTVPETVAIEGALQQEASIYSFEPTSRHRRQKAEELRERYDEIADMVEAHYNA